MSISREQLIRKYVSALHKGDSALFVGAGLSRPSGFVDWRALMAECGEELGLDVKREHDLVAVAQYYLNRRGRDRSGLNQLLLDEFGKPGSPSDNHKIIARLAIPIVWTTNFDTLLEDSYDAAKVRADVKKTDASIGVSLPSRDVVLYKMHGDIASPEEIIICKDDYERYAVRHQAMQNTLEADLLGKTFLFLGFSFTDPNLDYMLGHLRSLLGDSKREHYSIMRRVLRSDFPSGNDGEDEFRYEENKQGLQIEDLQRYSIQTLLVHDYSDITEVLTEIEQSYYLRNVFVSGSAHEYGVYGEDAIHKLCHNLGQRLMEEGLNLVSGFGLGIGSAVIMGALSTLYQAEGAAHLEDRLVLRPFPQGVPTHERQAFYRLYREDMIGRSGFAVFIAGNRSDAAIAPGVIQEYEISRQFFKTPIPIGATGYAARQIWETLRPKIEGVYSGVVSAHLYDELNNSSLDPEALVNRVIDIIKLVRGT
ncbi:MAG: SIR2 family protein [Armatimonadota bacterium]|nr:SIR2 family protein [Armatimonadota bacterium]